MSQRWPLPWPQPIGWSGTSLDDSSYYLTNLVITNNAEASAYESGKDAFWIFQGDPDFKYSLLSSNLITPYVLALSLTILFPECSDLVLPRKKLFSHFSYYSTRLKTFSYSRSKCRNGRAYDNACRLIRL